MPDGTEDIQNDSIRLDRLSFDELHLDSQSNPRHARRDDAISSEDLHATQQDRNPAEAREEGEYSNPYERYHGKIENIQSQILSYDDSSSEHADSDGMAQGIRSYGFKSSFNKKGNQIAHQSESGTVSQMQEEPYASNGANAQALVAQEAMQQQPEQRDISNQPGAQQQPQALQSLSPQQHAQSSQQQQTQTQQSMQAAQMQYPQGSSQMPGRGSWQPNPYQYNAAGAYAQPRYYPQTMPVQGFPQSMAGKFHPQKNNVILMAILWVLIAAFGVWQVFAQAYDNDIWFILATGEDILKNGIPYTNPFSVHEGLDIIVQQWIPCIITYLVYTNFDFLGVGILVLVLYGLVVASMYFAGRAIRRDKFGGEYLLLTILLAMVPMSCYTSIRPHLYSMLAFAWIIFFAEKYRQTNKIAYLIPIPLIAAIHINFQMAIAPFDVVILICYLIPDFLKGPHKKGKLRNIFFAQADYRRAPIAICAVLAAVALLANPYFLNGALYLFRSYGAANYENHISEMSPLAPAESYSYALMLVIFSIAVMCLARKGLRSIDLPLALLLIGTGAMGFMHIRNIWVCALFAYMYIAWYTSGKSIPLFIAAKHKKVFASIVGALGVAACGVLAYFAIPTLESEPKDNSYTPVKTFDYLEQFDIDKANTRVFTFFNSGGYIEYRGYKVNMDPRPEIWAPAITNAKKDYWHEYVDMSSGTMYFDTYIDMYDFDIFIVPSEQAANSVFKNNETYTEITGGDGYRAYAKKSLMDELGRDTSSEADVGVESSASKEQLNEEESSD